MKAETSVQPTLESLMAGYVRRQAEAEAQGLGRGEGLEVTPYEAGPVQPIDAKLAWDESLAVLSHFGVKAKGLKAPAGWVSLVAQVEPHVAVAFCVGNFPQLVRDFHALLSQGDLTKLRPASGTAIAIPTLEEWVAKASAFPDTMLATAACRLAKQFDRTEKIAQSATVEANVPSEWRAAWDNERAALLWHQGKADAAIAAWTSQPASLPVRFNLAMAGLFTGKNVKAELESVMAELPERSAWHHLARLYHTLSAMR